MSQIRRLELRELAGTSTHIITDLDTKEILMTTDKGLTDEIAQAYIKLQNDPNKRYVIHQENFAHGDLLCCYDEEKQPNGDIVIDITSYGTVEEARLQIVADLKQYNEERGWKTARYPDDDIIVDYWNDGEYMDFELSEEDKAHPDPNFVEDPDDPDFD